ncbi:DUF5789 family protein [Halarchaeum sp. P4]|uniref:DUF5789 family protein n=1 Tax=Halarchaeum sp. P4 TaxID=3421639 RepID=UPI003EC05D2A
MALDPADTQERVAESCSFPADQETVLDAVGSVTLASPGEEAVELATVLERSDQSTFASARELHHTVLANLGEEYVGRPNYDDRSSNLARESQQSF